MIWRLVDPVPEKTRERPTWHRVRSYGLRPL
jgi:hypothetical protein